MSEFNPEQALRLCLATVRQRAERRRAAGRSSSYTMYYYRGSKLNRYDGKIKGSKVKELQSEFRTLGGGYNVAMIVRDSDGVVVSVFDRESKSKGFQDPRERKPRTKTATA